MSLFPKSNEGRQGDSGALPSRRTRWRFAVEALSSTTQTRGLRVWSAQDTSLLSLSPSPWAKLRLRRTTTNTDMRGAHILRHWENVRGSPDQPIHFRFSRSHRLAPQKPQLLASLAQDDGDRFLRYWANNPRAAHRPHAFLLPSHSRGVLYGYLATAVLPVSFRPDLTGNRDTALQNSLGSFTVKKGSIVRRYRILAPWLGVIRPARLTPSPDANSISVLSSGSCSEIVKTDRLLRR